MATKKSSSGKKAVSAKATAPKKVVVMASAKKAVAKPAAKKAKVPSFPVKPELGFTQSKSGILIPAGNELPSYVTTGKLQAGIESAKDQIKGTLQNIAAVFTQDFEVSEIELSVTFTADGKFLGFGTGGAMSVKVKIRPTKESDA